jgi:hypothetical protein
VKGHIELLSAGQRHLISDVDLSATFSTVLKTFPSTRASLANASQLAGAPESSTCGLLLVGHRVWVLVSPAAEASSGRLPEDADIPELTRRLIGFV